MKLLPLEQLGPQGLPSNGIRFGILLPFVSEIHGHALFVKTTPSTELEG